MGKVLSRLDISAFEQFVKDLEGVISELGQKYDLGGEHGILQEYCPTCKRVLRGVIPSLGHHNALYQKYRFNRKVAHCMP